MSTFATKNDHKAPPKLRQNPGVTNVVEVCTQMSSMYVRKNTFRLSACGIRQIVRDDLYTHCCTHHHNCGHPAGLKVLLPEILLK